MDELTFEIRNFLIKIKKIEYEETSSKLNYIKIYCTRKPEKSQCLYQFTCQCQCHEPEERLLDEKYCKVRRRLYNNIVNIEKLKDGRIRDYQVHNELELITLINYLNKNDILFRVYENKKRSHISFYSDYYMICPLSSETYHPINHKLHSIYIRVFKGYINIHRYNHSLNKIKYKINLNLYNYIDPEWY
jgi:hypothetical protein